MIKFKSFFSPVYFLVLYFTNRIVTFIPISSFRKIWYKCFGMKIGLKTKIDMGQYILSPFKIKIGNYSHINQGCLLDGRSNITIGNNVSISFRCSLITGSHDINSTDFKYKGDSINIGDNVFVGVNATILQGIKIGNGAVVCAGAVVTNDIPDYAIVAGVPAKIIGYRNKNINYKCKPDIWFL